MFLLKTISVYIIVLTITKVQGRYQYIPDINGWVTLHKIGATWDEAFQQCEDESAILMSPINTNMYNAMLSLNEDNIACFIGTRTIFNPKIFVSIEGVLLHQMPVQRMFTQLDQEHPACLSMDHDFIRDVPCTSRLPYMCYKEKKSELKLTDCGTFDREYKYSSNTGSCYKVHEAEKRTWTDAYSTCIAEGGYLVVINDETEAEQIKKLTAMLDVAKQYVFIGLRCFGRKGNWRSIHGHKAEQIYNHWLNSLSIESWSCGVCEIDAPTVTLTSLADESINRTFICEKDPSYVMFSEN